MYHADVRDFRDFIILQRIPIFTEFYIKVVPLLVGYTNHDEASSESSLNSKPELVSKLRVLFLFSKERAPTILSLHPSYPQVTVSEHTHHPQPFGIHHIVHMLLVRLLKWRKFCKICTIHDDHSRRKIVKGWIIR